MKSYSEAGVDIDRGDRFVDFIKSIPSRAVSKGIGGFSAALPLDTLGFKPRDDDHNRRDGHEAPRRAAARHLRHDRNRPRGHECERPSGCGAKPVVFLDYIAAGGSSRIACIRS